MAYITSDEFLSEFRKYLGLGYVLKGFSDCTVVDNGVYTLRCGSIFVLYY